MLVSSDSFLSDVLEAFFFLPWATAARPGRKVRYSTNCRSPSLSWETEDLTTHAWRTSPVNNHNDNKRKSVREILSLLMFVQINRSWLWMHCLVLLYPLMTKMIVVSLVWLEDGQKYKNTFQIKLVCMLPLEGKAVPLEWRVRPGCPCGGGGAGWRTGCYSRAV